jgi:hypothetical protein
MGKGYREEHQARVHHDKIHISSPNLFQGRLFSISDKSIFYVMDLPDTIVILGVRWLSTLGPITTNYKTMEMSFNGENGKKVTLKGMSGNAPRRGFCNIMFNISSVRQGGTSTILP